MRRALEWCLKYITFLFGGRLWIQKDGIAMGSPLAPALADIFLNSLLLDRFNKDTNDIIYFTRYVDDILAILKDSSVVYPFLRFLNSLHPNIRFTVEEEVHDSLPFLDILITRNPSSISTAVYRKSTHSGVYTHYSSFVPFKFKRQLITNLVDRAYQLCSNWEILHRELENLRVTFMNNGYQRDFIYSLISKYVNKIYDPYIKPEGPKKKEIFIRLPYLGDASKKIENTLNGLFAHINYKFFYSYSRLTNKLRFKERSPLKSNTIYLLKCKSCNASYIGETCRNLQTRMSEHDMSSKYRDKNSHVYKHSSLNAGHIFNIDKPDILKFEQDYQRRKILEALYIQQHKPSLNVQKESYNLFLFNV